jgi:hypothetical protein
MWECGHHLRVGVRTYQLPVSLILTPSMTPGFEFLGRCLPIFFIPVFAAVTLQRIATQVDILIPTWVCVIGAMLSVPLYAWARIYYHLLSERREAARMGARFAPEVLGKLPGNVDAISMMVENFKHGYIGTTEH